MKKKRIKEDREKQWYMSGKRVENKEKVAIKERNGSKKEERQWKRKGGGKKGRIMSDMKEYKERGKTG